ncbi:unknown [Lachnospiraceae bacterium CAG:364]|nr:unknown [Lachnospiraceae bacterium CAG:364]
MRKQLNKIKKLHKSISFNFHWYMLSVKYDTVFIIINIRRILKSPLAFIDCNRNNSVVFSCRMVQSSGISFIFYTELAFRISACFCIFCSCNGFRVFFWFGKVNGNINGSIRAFHCPFLVLFNTIAANIVAVLT